ncbi:MAG: PIN domain-containing protein [Bryobacterales bacterium]|nr:PIN domain-containing protein [Bryobacterales bacterium]
MAQYFFDTSAAVKYYHVEAGTPAVSAIFEEPGRQIRISTLRLLEIQSAFAMKVRSGVLDRNAAGTQRLRLMLDVAAGDIEVYDLTVGHFLTAERLIGKYAYSHRLRTLDALQLAVAIDLATLDLVDYFVVADKVLGEVAVQEGLKTINPETA